jgi:hypothetical protein
VELFLRAALLFAMLESAANDFIFRCFVLLKLAKLEASLSTRLKGAAELEASGFHSDLTASGMHFRTALLSGVGLPVRADDHDSHHVDTII